MIWFFSITSVYCNYPYFCVSSIFGGYLQREPKTGQHMDNLKPLNPLVINGLRGNFAYWEGALGRLVFYH